MNTIPLVKGNTQEEINTSLIALKKALDEMNSSSSKTDASVQSQITDLQPVDSVTSGNMQSVTSNAVANALSYLWNEVFTGKYWVNGKPIYRKVISLSFINNVSTGVQVSSEIAANDYQVIDLGHSYIYNADYGTRQPWASNATAQTNMYISSGRLSFETTHPSGILYAVCEYTKTTD